MALGLALIFVLGAALRIQRAHEPTSNFDDYTRLGSSLRVGGILCFTREDHPSARRGALYPSFLALFQSAGPEGPRWAKIALSSGEILMAGALGTLITTPLSGLLAALLVAVHPTLTRSCTLNNIEPFYGFFVLAAAWSLAFWLHRPSPRRAWLAGFFVSVSLTCRSVLFAFPIALCCGIWILQKKFLPGRKQAIAFLVSSYIFLLPWIARNAFHIGVFIPFEQNLITDTLSATSLGLTEFPPEQGYVDGLAHAWGCGAQGNNRDKCLITTATRRIMAHPFLYVGSCVSRFLYAVKLHYALILLALLSFVFYRNNPKLNAIGILCVYFVTIYAPFALVPRFFEPIIPCLLVLDGCALAGSLERLWAGAPFLKSRLGARRRPWTCIALPIVVASLYLASIGYLARESALITFPCLLPETALSLFRCGRAREKGGQTEKAAACYEKALTRPGARQSLDPVLLAKLAIHLGLCRWRLAPDRPSIVPLIDEAVALSPEVVHDQAMTLQDERDIAGTRLLLARLIKLYPKSGDYLVDRGIVSFLHGRKNDGIQDFERAALVDPKNVRALYHFGFAREWRHDMGPALQAYTLAGRLGLEQQHKTLFFNSSLNHYVQLAEDARKKFSGPGNGPAARR